MAVTFGVGLAAVNTGNNLLYLVLGLMLSLLLLSGVLSDVVRYRLELQRFLPERAFAGQDFFWSLEIRNIKRLPSYALDVVDLAEEDQAADALARPQLRFLRIGPEEVELQRARGRRNRRGVVKLEALIVRTQYPFGLIEKTTYYRKPGELLVYPAVHWVDAEAFLGGDGGEEAPLPRLGTGTEVAGLRGYRDGDEARDVHWLRSAALGEMVVRERHAESRSTVNLIVDQRRPEHDQERWEREFEVQLSYAASLAPALLERGAAVQVFVRGAQSPLALPGEGADALWRFLALLEPLDFDSSVPLPEPESAHRITAAQAAIALPQSVVAKDAA